jgi:hypothetical protein
MTKLNDILTQLIKQNPSIKYKQGSDFKWSHKTQTIFYINKNDKTSIWALIHETAHAQLNHHSYKTDQQLLNLELQAWQQAQKIANTLDTNINQDYIEDCLDTYRDWLHKRSTCPNCDVTSTQNKLGIYKCFNCLCSWKVPASPQCKIIKTKLSF